MKTLYLECNMGAAGDMMTAALYELLDAEKREEFLAKMNHLGIPGVKAEAETSVKCGITGTHMKITISGAEEESLDVAHGPVHTEENPHCHEHEHGEGEAHFHEHEHGEGEPHFHEHEHGEGEAHFHEHEHGEGEPHFHEHEHGEGESHCHEHEHGEGEAHFHEHEHEEGGPHFHEHEHGEKGHHFHDHAHGEGHQHHHTSLADIRRIAENMQVSEKVRKDILAVYTLIAQAEGEVHGRSVEEIHFHEVGSMDAVSDIAGVCILMEMLSPDRVIASPVNTGYGEVRCAHGILPVPAPAAAWLLKGIPAYSGDVRGELCTPTGAALLKYFADSFGPMPVMCAEAVGYGMGQKDFEHANCLRALFGETQEKRIDMVTELSCNLDDMTPEEIGFAQEKLFECGALEVFTLPAGMKKNRPGVLLTCLCRPENEEKTVETMFRFTTTIGIRKKICERYVMERSEKTAETASGPVRVKESSGYGICRAKAEYEDLARIAREKGLTLAGIRKLANDAVKETE